MIRALFLVILFLLLSICAFAYRLLRYTEMQWDLQELNAAVATEWRQNIFASIREEETKRQARSWKEKINAMLILPGERPLAEPPAMLWNVILKDQFSEARLTSLCKDDVEKRAQAMDLKGELLALGEYGTWTDNMEVDPETHGLRREFYKKLGKEVCRDHQCVMDEWDKLHETATDLGRSEYRWLDKDGKTTEIERKLRTGELLLRDWGQGVHEKYTHLEPTGYEDRDGGTQHIAGILDRGINIFEGYGDEAKRKYEHLTPFEISPLGFWEHGCLDKDGGTTQVERGLKRVPIWLRTSLRNIDPFHGAPKEVWEKYADLMPLYHSVHRQRDPNYDPAVKGAARDEWKKYYLQDRKWVEAEERSLLEMSRGWKPALHDPNYVTIMAPRASSCSSNTLGSPKYNANAHFPPLTTVVSTCPEHQSHRAQDFKTIYFKTQLLCPYRTNTLTARPCV